MLFSKDNYIPLKGGEPRLPCDALRNIPLKSGRKKPGTRPGELNREVSRLGDVGCLSTPSLAEAKAVDVYR